MSQDDTNKGWVRRTVGRRDTASSDGSARASTHPPVEGFGTFIEQGANFEGTLRLSGSFRIDAEFKGTIVSEGKVIVGEAGGVESDIRAREVVIAGAVAGNVTVSRQLTIRSTGRLHGNAETPCLEIERGAVFNGRTTMVRPEVAVRAERAAAPSADAPHAPESRNSAQARGVHP
ncbi:MAG: polymer-forming cytoskeletal protein [Myxococcota bacterium]